MELLRRSRHDWTLYTNHFEPASTFAEFAGLRVIELRPVSVRRTLADVARAGITLMTQRLDLSQHDALIVVSEGLGNLVAARSTIPTSCVCLTPLKIAYDDETRRRYFARGGAGIHHRLAIRLYAEFERRAWKRYIRVFCDSGETRRRLLDARLVDERRLDVVHPGVDSDRFRPTGEREPFFLVPGRIMWSKNIELAIRAWRRFKPDPTSGLFRLVVVGMVDEKSRPYLGQLRKLAGERSDITFVESPDDCELLRLYQWCHAAIVPSLNEDWGLVALEAMACGKAVLATDRGGLRESVIDGETGFLCRDDEEVFEQAIARLVSLPSSVLDRIGLRARARAADFTWGAFVDRIDAHIDLAIWPGRPFVRLNRAPVGSGLR